MTSFVLTYAEKTCCPRCGSKPTLLSHRSRFKPAFYICWPCRKVFEVGKGEVIEETKESNV